MTKQDALNLRHGDNVENQGLKGIVKDVGYSAFSVLWCDGKIGDIMFNNPDLLKNLKKINE